MSPAWTACTGRACAGVRHHVGSLGSRHVVTTAVRTASSPRQPARCRARQLGAGRLRPRLGRPRTEPRAVHAADDARDLHTSDCTSGPACDRSGSSSALPMGVRSRPARRARGTCAGAAGSPKPELQYEVYDVDGRLVGRTDLRVAGARPPRRVRRSREVPAELQARTVGDRRRPRGEAARGPDPRDHASGASSASSGPTLRVYRRDGGSHQAPAPCRPLEGLVLVLHTRIRRFAMQISRGGAASYHRERGIFRRPTGASASAAARRARSRPGSGRR